MKMDGFGMADEFIGNAVGKCMRPWRCPDSSKRRDYEMLQKKVGLKVENLEWH